MKTWTATYTLDNGLTFQTMSVHETNYSRAYINVLLNIPHRGIITELTEGGE